MCDICVNQKEIENATKALAEIEKAELLRRMEAVDKLSWKIGDAIVKQVEYFERLEALEKAVALLEQKCLGT